MEFKAAIERNRGVGDRYLYITFWNVRHGISHCGVHGVASYKEGIWRVR